MNTPFSRAPHQGPGGPMGSGAPNAALLIDFDNVTMGMRSDLSKDLKKLLQSDIIRGKVTVQRAYADWRRYPQYIVPLSEASIDLIFAPAYGSSKKNATDIRMAIDAVELVFVRPEIGTFILLTGDSDFSSLVLKLKEYGKYVIGVGIQESSSDILVQNCDEYYSYTSLTGLRKTSDNDRTATDPWVLVEKAVNRMAERDDVMRSDRLKQVMIEIDAGFNEGDFGYSKFSRFLSEAAAKNLVQLRKLENGQYEVGPTGSGRGEGRKGRREEGREGRGRSGERGRASRERTREAAETPRERSRDTAEGEAPREIVEPPQVLAPTPDTEADAPVVATSDGGQGPLQSAYGLLRRALETLRDQGRDAIRDSDVKRKMLELDAGFDETELGFGKFSRFLRQAHDHSVVDLHKKEGGNYEVSLHGTTPPATESGTVPSSGARPGPDPQAVPQDQGREDSAPEASPDGAGTGSTEWQTVQPAAPSRGVGPRRGSTRRRQDEGPPPLLEGQSAAPVGEAPARRGRQPRESAPAAMPPGSGRSNRGALGLPTEAEEQIRYLTGYRGVGRKTAEALVEGFGNDLFTVLQNEPERLGSVVPSGRAEQVLEAWKADFEKRTAESHGPQQTSLLQDDPGEPTGGPGGPGGSGRRRTRRGRRGGGRDRTS